MSSKTSSSIDEEIGLVDKLAESMHNRLEQARKRNPLHWLACERSYLEQRLRSKVNALVTEIDPDQAQDLAADVANYAAMIADKARKQLADERN